MKDLRSSQMTQASALSLQSSSNPVSWLITGGCGFIGTNLIVHLLKENHPAHIRVLDNLSVGTREDLHSVCDFTEIAPSSLGPHPCSASVELIVGDITDPEICNKCSKDMDVIVHLAANTGVAPSVENPRKDMKLNVNGTLNVLESARYNGVNRFIFASSGASIGQCEPPIHEELAPHPVSPYGASKLAGEGYCSAYFHTFGLQTVCLRFGNVYGPGSSRKNSVVAKFMRQTINGEALEIYGDGGQTRDFIYIDDLTDAICLAASVEGIAGEIFQIATYRETSVKEIALTIKEIVEKEIGKKVRIIHSDPRVGDVMKNYSNITKAKNRLGYEPAIELHKGLRKTFEYFKNT